MKLSIITINYNNAAGLKKTIDSVVMQTCTNFEHIIVDGASTDGSVDVIREYENNLISNQKPLASNLKWLSEPDTGIYNAMNKGIKIAKGEYLLMLNSGDYLIIDNLESEIFPLLTGEDIVQGNLVLHVQDKYFIHKGYAHSDLSFIEIHHGDFPHQSMFIKKSLHDTYGYYDESYRFIADTLFFLKTLGLGNASFKYVDKTIAFFAPGGASVQHAKERENERKRMFDENLSKRLQNLCIKDENKIAMYDTLHSNRVVWYITIILLNISKLLQKNKKRIFEADKKIPYNGIIE